MNSAKHSTRLAWVRSTLDRYEGPLTRYAVRLTGNVESARDVVQETFLRLCSEDPAQVDGHVAQWLFTVCRNRAMDMRRKEGRMQAASESGVVDPTSGACDPGEIVEGREIARRALGALATLPQQQQEIIRLRFQNGLSYTEIASVTELTVSHVGYLIHVAIKGIREKLNE